MRRLARLVLCAALAMGWTASWAAEPMTPPELDAQRGGYLTVGGVSFDFGATISTFVDGKLALQSGFTLADAGLLARQTGTGALPASPAYAVANLAGDGGATQILQLASPSQLSNVVLNTASNRTISQTTAVTLTVPGLAGLQSQFALQRLGAQLNAAAMTSRLGR